VSALHISERGIIQIYLPPTSLSTNGMSHSTAVIAAKGDSTVAGLDVFMHVNYGSFWSLVDILLAIYRWNPVPGYKNTHSVLCYLHQVTS